MEKRLDRLRIVYQRRGVGPDAHRYDLSGLTQDEVLELDDLLRAPAMHQLRTGTVSYAMHSPAQMARFEQLWSLVKMEVA